MSLKALAKHLAIAELRCSAQDRGSAALPPCSLDRYRAARRALDVLLDADPEPHFAVAPLLARIDAVQQPTGQCPVNRPIVLARMGGGPSACLWQGLWGKVARLAGALGHAVQEGRPVAMQRSDNWVNAVRSPSRCAGRGWECYFLQTAGSNEGCRLPRSATDPDWGAAGAGASDRPAAQGHVLAWSACMHENMERGVRLPGDRHVNRFFGSSPAGVDEEVWRAALLHFLVRPQPRILLSMSRRLLVDGLDSAPADGDAGAASGRVWRRPVVAVHFRRGDKYGWRTPAQNRAAWEEHYMPAVAALVKRYGAKTVFVATECPDLVLDLRSGRYSSLGGSGGGGPSGAGPRARGSSSAGAATGSDAPRIQVPARFAWAGHVSRRRAGTWQQVKGRPSAAGNRAAEAETENAIFDLLLMGAADHLVGTHTSTMSHVARALQIARSGRGAEHGPADVLKPRLKPAGDHTPGAEVHWPSWGNAGRGSKSGIHRY
jgi:hypothetical protein